ncbi:hypothetical protein CEV33_3753 [Brucella grignonensis]|uniref:Uncharacterized protein n=1 Tax=Brucella grignonensis TaxID=94627 RepID=A0A256EYE4_9HYPH|nr:hypothetical protein CEV33_3753 [Brucella grignonensis]
MLPGSKDCPADLDEVVADPPVTRAIAFDFLQPNPVFFLTDGGWMLHPCQKQPSRKIAMFKLGKAMSQVMRFILGTG